jgi:hypothetical protein
VRGDPDDPAYGGYTCVKGRELPDSHNSENRLHHSLVRNDAGEFVETPMPEALAHVAAELRRIIDTHGPHSVAVFMGSGLIRELGYFNPPGLEHLYLDDSWKWVGLQLGTLRYIPEVVIEHLHYLNGKAPQDALYAEVNDPTMYAHDRAAFTAWANGPAADDLQRVREAMA